jgi:hypothetical protein
MTRRLRGPHGTSRRAESPRHPVLLSEAVRGPARGGTPSRLPRALAFRALPFALALALAGCGGDVLGPGTPLEGTWVLRTVDGARLPAVTQEGGGMRYTLLADTLRLTRTGSASRVQVVRQQNADPRPYLPADTTYAMRITRPYAVRGRTLTVGELEPCPPNANCLGVDQGFIDGDRILLTRHAMLGSDAVLAFDRVSGS